MRVGTANVASLSPLLSCVNNIQSFARSRIILYGLTHASSSFICVCVCVCVGTHWKHMRAIYLMYAPPHPPRTTLFFHLAVSSASVFEVGYPGVWGIQSRGLKPSGSALFGPSEEARHGSPVVYLPLSLSLCCLQSLPAPVSPLRDHPCADIHDKRPSSSSQMVINPVALHVLLPIH